MAYILVLSTLVFSCQPTESTNTSIPALEGKHELRRFKTTTESGERWSAGYFLIAGSAHGETYSNTKASFSWKMNTGEYAISEIELSRIRVRIDDSVSKPYVTFEYTKRKSYYYTRLEHLMESYVEYMVITCKEEDYPINIKLTEL